MSAPVQPASGQAPVTGTAVRARTNPDLTEPLRRYPPRPPSAAWPATEQPREVLLERLLSRPLTLPEEMSARQRRRPGLTRLLDWLALAPGTNWQQRWMASGADTAGNAEW